MQDTSLWEFYALVVGIAAINEIQETLKSERGTDTWWVKPSGVGLGTGVYMTSQISGSSLVHIPIFVLTTLVITILTNNIIKHWKSNLR